jgi:hypothetical protein
MTFNIGQQNAGVINNVAGDMTVHGGQVGTLASVPDALAAVELIRDEIARCALPPEARTAAAKELDGMEHDLRQAAPNKATIGESLTRLTKLLVTTGALVTGTTALLNGLGGLATWLGHFGSAARQLLTRLA